MPDWMKHKLESRLQGEISITSDMQMTPPLWQKANEYSGLISFRIEWFAGVQPQLIQGIRRRDGIGEGQETTA